MLSDPAHHLHLGSAPAGQGTVGQPGPTLVCSGLTGRQAFTLHFAGLLPLSRCQGPGREQAVPSPGAPSPGAPLILMAGHRGVSLAQAAGGLQLWSMRG